MSARETCCQEALKQRLGEWVDDGVFRGTVEQYVLEDIIVFTFDIQEFIQFLVAVATGSFTEAVKFDPWGKKK